MTSDSIIRDIDADVAKSSLQSSNSRIPDQEPVVEDSEKKASKVHSTESAFGVQNQGLGHGAKAETDPTSIQQSLERKELSETFGVDDALVNLNKGLGQEKPAHGHSKIIPSDAVQPSPRQSSFTMPVFEDIEKTSFSLEDFMEDSLDHNDNN
jgi:hypothetical protein